MLQQFGDFFSGIFLIRTGNLENRGIPALQSEGQQIENTGQ